MLRRAGFPALACLLLVSSGPLLGKGILIIPSHLFVSADGDSEQTLTVKPTTGEPTLVAIGVQPFLLDPDGRPRLGARDEANRTRPDLLTVEPRLLHLEGSPATLTVHLHAPEAGSAWAAIVLDVEPVETDDGGGGDVSVVTRVIVPVVVTRTVLEPPRLAIDDVRAHADADGIDVTARVRNDGTSVVRTYAELTIEETGVEIATQRVEDLILLPGLSRNVHGRVATKAAQGLDDRPRKVVVFIPVGGRLFEAAAVLP
jgi:hypothetical protein